MQNLALVHFRLAKAKGTSLDRNPMKYPYFSIVDQNHWMGNMKGSLGWSTVNRNGVFEEREFDFVFRSKSGATHLEHVYLNITQVWTQSARILRTIKRRKTDQCK